MNAHLEHVANILRQVGESLSSGKDHGGAREPTGSLHNYGREVDKLDRHESVANPVLAGVSNGGWRKMSQRQVSESQKLS